MDPAVRRPYGNSHHDRVPRHDVARQTQTSHRRMIEEHRNFGLAGGTLKVVKSPARALAFELTIESNRRWHDAEAQLYLELGLDAAEYHANWGVA